MDNCTLVANVFVGRESGLPPLSIKDVYVPGPKESDEYVNKILVGYIIPGFSLFTSFIFLSFIELNGATL